MPNAYLWFNEFPFVWHGLCPQQRGAGRVRRDGGPPEGSAATRVLVGEHPGLESLTLGAPPPGGRVGQQGWTWRVDDWMSR